MFNMFQSSLILQQSDVFQCMSYKHTFHTYVSVLIGIESYDGLTPVSPQREYRTAPHQTHAIGGRDLLHLE